MAGFDDRFFGLIPDDENANPLEILRRLTDPGVGSAASASASALRGEEAPEAPRLPGRGQPGVDNRTGRRISSSNFQKGFLKGVDKGVFLGILGDALAASLGQKAPGLHRQALDAKAQKDSLQARAKQLDEQRKFDDAQLEKRISATAAEGKATRESRETIAEAGVAARQQAAIDNAARESEAAGLRASGNIRATVVADTFRGISEFPDLRIPTHLDAASVLADESGAKLEEVRNLIAPHRKQHRLDQIEARLGASGRKQQEELTAENEFQMDLFMNGERAPTKGEQDQGQVGPVPLGKTIQERAENAMLAAGGDVRDDLSGDIEAAAETHLTEFRRAAGMRFRQLDEDLQAVLIQRFKSQVVATYKQAQQTVLAQLEAAGAAVTAATVPSSPFIEEAPFIGATADDLKRARGTSFLRTTEDNNDQ